MWAGAILLVQDICWREKLLSGFGAGEMDERIDRLNKADYEHRLMTKAVWY